MVRVPTAHGTRTVGGSGVTHALLSGAVTSAGCPHGSKFATQRGKKSLFKERACLINRIVPVGFTLLAGVTLDEAARNGSALNVMRPEHPSSLPPRHGGTDRHLISPTQQRPLSTWSMQAGVDPPPPTMSLSAVTKLHSAMQQTESSSI